MTSSMQLLAFIGVVQLAAMSPGPDFVLVTRRGALSGRRAGTLATIVGAQRRVFASARVRRALDAMTGTVLIALGIRIATQARPVQRAQQATRSPDRPMLDWPA